MLKLNRSIRMSNPDIERSKWTGGSSEEVTFECVRPDVNTGVLRPETPQKRGYLIADREVLYERYTPNSDTSREWKNFQHFKRVSEEPKLGIDVVQYTDSYVAATTPTGPICAGRHSSSSVGGPPNGASQWFDPFAGETKFYQPEADGTFVSLPENWAQLKTAALNRLLPEIRPDLSLINSLIELGDVKAQTRRTLSMMKATAKQIAWRSLTLKQIAKQAADLKLQYAFNILPTLSDITGIRTSLIRLEGRINDLINRMNKPQRRYYIYRWREHDDVADTATTPYAWYPLAEYPRWFGSVKQDRFVTYAPTEFHACMEYVYTFSNYQIEHARLLGLLDSLGVNLNPAIIWNAIRYSFIVDWVWNVSSWLSQFRVSNMEPQINIRNFSCSIKRSRRGFVQHQSCLGTDWPVSGNTVPQPIVEETAYRRICNLPAYAELASSGLSPREIVLGGALVVSQSRSKLKRTRIRAR